MQDFLRPSLSTLISKTSGTEQGGSMGLMQSFDSLGRIVGPVIGGAIYELHMDYTFALGGRAPVCHHAYGEATVAAIRTLQRR